MKDSSFRVINKISFISTLMIGLSSTVNAASYQMTIVSGARDVVVYGPPSETISDLAGKAVNFTVTDDYQQLTIDEGRGGSVVGMYKTLTFSGGNKLYSSDGIKFFYDYWGYCAGCAATAGATLNEGNFSYSYDSKGNSGAFHERYVATTPIPATMWLFGTPVLGLLARKRFSKSH